MGTAPGPRSRAAMDTVRDPCPHVAVDAVSGTHSTPVVGAALDPG
ncbi:hypothetical protein ACFYSC_09790 [Streptosporangium sp. NPDC004379]